VTSGGGGATGAVGRSAAATSAVGGSGAGPAAAAPAGPAAKSSGSGISPDVARVFLAGDAAALLDSSALRELSAPLARAMRLEARHQIEDDLDVALGDWRSGAEEAAPTDNVGTADPMQRTAWQRVQGAWHGGRTYLKKYWGIGVSMKSEGEEAPEGAAAAGGGGSGGAAAGGSGAAAGGSGGGAGAKSSSSGGADGATTPAAAPPAPPAPAAAKPPK